jgi:hypothetical protein
MDSAHESEEGRRLPADVGQTSLPPSVEVSRNNSPSHGDTPPDAQREGELATLPSMSAPRGRASQSPEEPANSGGLGPTQANVEDNGGDHNRGDPASPEVEVPKPPVSPMPKPPQCTDPKALDGDWGPFYSKCPHWHKEWVACHDPIMEWPKAIRLHEDKMYSE